MARGTVKWFSDTKGYGFITTEGSEESPEVFVHFSAIEAQGSEPCIRARRWSSK